MNSAIINATASGDTEVVAAVADRKIRVIGLLFGAADGVSVKFKSGSNDLTGAMPQAENGGVSCGVPGGIFETNAGEALNINLSSAVAVGGVVSYLLI